jgi:hypothetical protein
MYIYPYGETKGNNRILLILDSLYIVSSLYKISYNIIL